MDNFIILLLLLLLVLLLLIGIVGIIWLTVLKAAKGSVKPRPSVLVRARENPIIRPRGDEPWEANAVFNPAALYLDGRVHLLYRALGPDGISRIGYASSEDGITFDVRLREPVFIPNTARQVPFKNPFASSVPHAPVRGRYDPVRYASGGGWGGSEDPRAVEIDGRVYMTFSSFNGWDSIRMSVASLSTSDFLQRHFNWSGPNCLSPAHEVHKNWVLFPEKINGKFAVLHAVSPSIQVDFVNDIEAGGKDRGLPIQSTYGAETPGREGMWDSWVRGAGPPPLKTEHGWLLFYHGVDKRDPSRIKIGAMLLDLKDPTTVLYRCKEPVLSPDAPYENDWKPGVVYACGAIVKEGTLFVYYGGGDKTVNVATAPLSRFLKELMEHGRPLFGEERAVKNL